MYTYTHTAVLRLFVQDYPGRLVPEETFTRSHLKRVVGVYHSVFYEAWGRGKCVDNPAGRHPIRTIDAPIFIIPQFYASCPFCCNPPKFVLAWDTKYAGLHTWKLGLE